MMASTRKASAMPLMVAAAASALFFIGCAFSQEVSSVFWMPPGSNRDTYKKITATTARAGPLFFLFFLPVTEGGGVFLVFSSLFVLVNC